MQVRAIIANVSQAMIRPVHSVKQSMPLASCSRIRISVWVMTSGILIVFDKSVFHYTFNITGAPTGSLFPASVTNTPSLKFVTRNMPVPRASHAGKADTQNNNPAPLSHNCHRAFI